MKRLAALSFAVWTAAQAWGGDGAWTALSTAPLGEPQALSVSAGPLPRLDWGPVKGAALYRVAVLDAPAVTGHRDLLAAEWVTRTSWTYGLDKGLSPASGLVSTPMKPLPVGHKVRFMVRAADAKGGRLGAWSGVDFQYDPDRPAEGKAPVFVPLLSATAQAGEEQASDDGDGQDGADLELDSSKDEGDIRESGQSKTPTAETEPEPASDELEAP